MEQLKAENSAACGQSALTGVLGARPLNCDQVAWMLNAIERYLPTTNHPRVSRAREMQKYALLYELMEVAHLYFEDGPAQHNGTPPDVRRFQFASKLDEMNKTAKALGLDQINPAEEQAVREHIRAIKEQAPNADVTGLPPAQTVELPPKPAGGRSELT